MKCLLRMLFSRWFDQHLKASVTTFLPLAFSKIQLGEKLKINEPNDHSNTLILEKKKQKYSRELGSYNSDYFVQHEFSPVGDERNLFGRLSSAVVCP